MRTKEKDLLMICKGYYNNKYHTTFDALKAYQSKITGCSVENITDMHIFNSLLNAAVDFFYPNDWKQLITDGLVNDMLYAQSGIMPEIYPEKDIKITYRYLIDKFIMILALLQVKENDEWIIDLTDYQYVKEII